MLSEEHTEDFDIEETNNKLGVLWTWGFDPGGSQQLICMVLGAEEVHKTAPMMLHWEPNTANWSIKHGVFRKRFLMDTHMHMLFPKQCKCLD